LQLRHYDQYTVNNDNNKKLLLHYLRCILYYTVTQKSKPLDV